MEAGDDDPEEETSEQEEEEDGSTSLRPESIVDPFHSSNKNQLTGDRELDIVVGKSDDILVGESQIRSWSIRFELVKIF